MVLNFRGSFDPRIFFNVFTVTICTSAWCVLSVESTTRYRESQVSLAVTLWLSRVVVDWTCTSVGVDVRARLFVDRRCVNVYIRGLKIRG